MAIPQTEQPVTTAQRGRHGRRVALLLLLTLAFALPGACDVEYDAARPRAPKIRIVTESTGTGAVAEPGDLVAAHYTGRLPSGEIFVDTRDEAQPHRWTLGDGSVIKGMDHAVRGMRAGGVREVVIPPELHWGRGGYGGVVPENVAVRFRIELRSVR